MITDAHRAFARAVVALAEQHGVAHVHLTFDFMPDDLRAFNDRVSASWNRDKVAIELRTDLVEQIRKEEPTY
jgi:hypothetical protein